MPRPGTYSQLPQQEPEAAQARELEDVIDREEQDPSVFRGHLVRVRTWGTVLVFLGLAAAAAIGWQGELATPQTQVGGKSPSHHVRHKKITLAGVPVFVKHEEEDGSGAQGVVSFAEELPERLHIPIETRKVSLSKEPGFIHTAMHTSRMKDWVIRLPPTWSTSHVKRLTKEANELKIRGLGCAGEIDIGHPSEKGLSFAIVRCTVKGLERLLLRFNREFEGEDQVFVEEDATIRAFPEIKVPQAEIIRLKSWKAYRHMDYPGENDVELMDCYKRDVEAAKSRVEEKGYCGFSYYRQKCFLKTCDGGLTYENLKFMGKHTHRIFYLYSPPGSVRARRLATMVENNPPWGLDRIDQQDLPGDQCYTTDPEGGKGVHVYILDTGINTLHSDFTGRAVPTLEVISDVSRVCNPADSTCALDKDGHGTHCAGTVGGAKYGVAKATTLHAVKVLTDDGRGSFSWFVRAMDWVTVNAQRPAIISASLGGFGTVLSIDAAIQAATSSGITVIVAAGNEGQSTYPDACKYTPASSPDSITVGASSATDARAAFSNYGTCVDILAPGQAVASATHNTNTGEKTMSGTSMATPHVAGAAAMLLSKNPTWRSTDVKSALIASAARDKLTDVRGSPNLLLSIMQAPSTTTTTTTQNPVPCSAVIDASGITGPCTLNTTSCCISSPNFPKNYAIDSVCIIEMVQNAVPGPLSVPTFKTEATYDKLTVNGAVYSGSSSPKGVTPEGKINWASDFSVTQQGWQICFEGRKFQKNTDPSAGTDIPGQITKIEGQISDVKASVSSVESQLAQIKSASAKVEGT